MVFACACCFVAVFTMAQTISGTINSYYQVTGINIIPNTVTVSSSAGLSPGVKVLIIQAKGATINTSNTSSFGNISALNNAGNYEFNYICGVSGNTILLQYELLRSYDVGGSVQLIPVPQYNSVTVTDTVRAAAWNSATGTGGVLVLEARDTVFLNSVMDASGRGFSGGTLLNNTNCVWSTNVADFVLPAVPADANSSSSKKGEGIADFITNGEYGRGKQANGGGGGNNHNTGGAGGSNYGTGGNGGERSNETFFQCHGASPGVGGLSLSGQGYSAANNRIFMGGGGGAGHQNNSVGTPGGNGGGIIILVANTIYNNSGKLLANGGAPYNPACANPLNAEGDGGGGGGAGGTIVLHVQQIVNGELSAEVKGAAGSSAGWATNNCTGPGGGGGGGVIWVSNAGLLTNIADSTSGGINGVISPLNSTVACRGAANNATAGGNGASLTGYILPNANQFVCAPLAANELLAFEGQIMAGGHRLLWKMRSIETIAYFELERSGDRVVFQTVAMLKSTGSLLYDAVDAAAPHGISYYRLKIMYKNGNSDYSKWIALQRNAEGFQWLAMYPNPARHQFHLGLVAAQQHSALIQIHNQMGQLCRSVNTLLRKGHNLVEINVEGLLPGVYFVGVHINGHHQVKKMLIEPAAR